MMRSGFSLVELSIVLVILGLLTGGILTGQNLIRAAELRSVTTEYSAYQTAANTFRGKYFAIPGDMRNATDFWGGATVANGNGDGELNIPGGGNTAGEIWGYWEHLAQAGMVEGSYNGLSGAANGFDATIGTNVPASKLSSGGWTAYYNVSTAITDTTWYEGSYGNIYILGQKTTNDSTNSPILSAEETWNIDTKVDDGRPGQGVLRVYENQGSATAGTGCGNAAAAATALAATTDYDLANDSVACTLLFNMN